jgi:insertion element IS1 protein InsB
MYVNGMGFRAIERVTGVHHTTVITWLKQVGETPPDAYAPETIPEVGERDELETLIWSVYPGFILEGDPIISKTYRIRVEGENTRLRHYLARLHRKTLCYSKSEEMLKHSIRLLIHYLKFRDVPVPT